MKKILFPVFILFFIFYLLAFPSESLDAAKSGLLLWFYTVIPTLLPFMILSNILIFSHSIYYITFFTAPILSRIFRVSKQGSYCILCGFLFGYPMGAKTVCDLLHMGQISKNEASRLILFCNNLSPMFLLGFAAALLPDGFPRQKELLLLIVLLSPIIDLSLFDLTSYIIKYFSSFLKSAVSSKEPASPRNNPSITVSELNSALPFPEKITFSIVDASIHNAFETIFKIGGYLILFSILSGIPQHFFPKHPVSFFLSCIMEITVGLAGLSNSALPFFILFPAMAALCSFGGFSALAQTAGFLSDEKLSLFSYFISKIMAALTAAILSVILLKYFSPAFSSGTFSGFKCFLCK